MDVLTWNVNGSFPPNGSQDSIDSQIDWLGSLECLPDVLLLQEVNPNQQAYWHESLLGRLEYQDLEDSIDWARQLGNSNGHITAVNGEWSLTTNKFGQSGFGPDGEAPDGFELSYPEKILVTDIELPETEIELWNVRAVPGGQYGVEKLKILEAIYDLLESADRRPRILAGDLNTPRAELVDGQAITYGYERGSEHQRRGVNAELKILKGLGHFGMVDVFRALHGFGETDAVVASHNENRFDHLFASEELGPIDCRYLEDGGEYSDHLPLHATFDFE